jgi:putative ABC transport system permease protein
MKNALSLRVFMPTANHTAARALAFRREALHRLAAIPGVENVAAGTNLPLFDSTMNVPFDLEDAPPRLVAQRPGVNYAAVSPDYFETLRIPLRSGRAFVDTDQETSPPVVIVNEAFVERYFPGQDPVGKRILLNRPILGKDQFEDSVRAQIVGVAGNVRLGLESPDHQPLVYAAAARRELAQLDGSLVVDRVSSLDQVFDAQFSGAKFQATIMNAFATLALLLAVIGIYGVNAYAVAQRRYEIGIRMAVGATPMRVLRTTIWSGMRLTLLGILVGLIGAIAGASLLRSVVVGVNASAPYTLAAVALVLSVISWIACYLPARRAMLIEPATALRQE